MELFIGTTEMVTKRDSPLQNSLGLYKLHAFITPISLPLVIAVIKRTLCDQKCETENRPSAAAYSCYTTTAHSSTIMYSVGTSLIHCHD